MTPQYFARTRIDPSKDGDLLRLTIQIDLSIRPTYLRACLDQICREDEPNLMLLLAWIVSLKPEFQQDLAAIADSLSLNASEG